MLPFYWKWSRRAWMTQEIFLHWYINYFCRTVLRFCRESELPDQVLVLDNASGHPANLAEVRALLELSVFTRHQTSLFQPMDRGVIAPFKVYYLRQTFMELVRDFDRSGKTMNDYWRSFDILKVINNINTAW
jgi:hypothetical protein